MAIRYAFRDTECFDCGTTILKDDPIYFQDEGKLCAGCAIASGIVCPKCNSQKKVHKVECFECHTAEYVNAEGRPSRPVRPVRATRPLRKS